MASGNLPLAYPDHFPPTKGWKKFFIGVRWLGPDLSFFVELKRQQADRRPEQMDVWGSGRKRDVAERLAQAFKKKISWPTAVFLPEDLFQVMCNGPRFGMLDDLASVYIVKEFEEHYRVRISNSFWVEREKSTFGDIVNALTTMVHGEPPK